MYDLQLQKTIVLRTHPRLQATNLHAAITMRFAKADLQTIIELHATASEIAAPKPDFDAKGKKRRFSSTY